MPVLEVTDASFQEKVVNSKTPVLVDLFAAWCEPCRLTEPILEELSGQHIGKIEFVKIDVDKNIATAQQLNVMSIPTTILFKDGKEVGRQVGFGGKKQFEEIISKAGL